MDTLPYGYNRGSPWHPTGLGWTTLCCATVMPLTFFLWPRFLAGFHLPGLAVLTLLVIGVSTIVPVVLGCLVNYRGKRYLGGGSRFGLVMVLAGLLNLVSLPFMYTAARDRAAHGRELSQAWVTCGSHLREIGSAILLYSNENDGHYPNSLGDLVLTQDITTDAFVCPFTNDSPATGNTRQAIAVDLYAGGHQSYVYVGKGLTQSEVTPNTVVAYEHPDNHRSTDIGLWVLYGDGHTDSVKPIVMHKIIEQLKTGHNPPQLP